mmetsp:Transcript_12283/g.37080  ORF Transcript_12283/g.37080 Transcript_12283/m.37080 type:complete len:326 (+) Transcript_12283:93-1070(+)
MMGRVSRLAVLVSSVVTGVVLKVVVDDADAATWALWQVLLSVGGPVEHWNEALTERWTKELNAPSDFRGPVEYRSRPNGSVPLDRPVIVRGFLSDAPWDLAWLEALDFREEIKYHGDATSKRGSLAPDRRGTLAEILPEIRGGSAKIVTEAVIRRSPELLRQLPLDRLSVFGSTSHYSPWRVGLSMTAPLFVGRRGRTELHAEPITDVVFQMQGTKKWSLVDPACWRVVRPRVSPTGRAYLHSDLDPDDLPNYPCLSQFDLGPRDLLFIPPFWFHRVDYLDDDVALGVSLFHFRFLPILLSLRNLFFFAITAPNIPKEVVGWKTQ